MIKLTRLIVISLLIALSGCSGAPRNDIPVLDSSTSVSAVINNTNVKEQVTHAESAQSLPADEGSAVVSVPDTPTIAKLETSVTPATDTSVSNTIVSDEGITETTSTTISEPAETTSTTISEPADTTSTTISEPAETTSTTISEPAETTSTTISEPAETTSTTISEPAETTSTTISEPAETTSTTISEPAETTSTTTSEPAVTTSATTSYSSSNALSDDEMLDTPVLALLSDAQQKKEAGDLSGAVSSLERAQRIAPQEPQVLYGLAQVSLAKGDATQAEQFARSGLSYASGRPELQSDLWIAIAQSRNIQGDKAGAAEARAQSIKVEND